MDGLVSFGNKRSYDDFKKNLSPLIQPLVDSIREFCLSLGENVLEDVRMHRVVFCKSISFRWFSDLEPEKESVLLKVQRDRKESLQIIRIKPNENLEDVKMLLTDAYNKIR